MLCPYLERIVLPSTVTEIGGYAFYQCLKLRNIVLPESLTTISSFLLFSCILLEELIIPNKVTEIGTSAFAECISLRFLYVPDSVKTISSDAFQFSKLERCGIFASEKEREIIKNNVSLFDSSFKLCIPEKPTYCENRYFFRSILYHFFILGLTKNQ